MTTTHQPTTPNPCRHCRASLTRCDRFRDLNDQPCCGDCSHPDDTTDDLGAVSEEW